MVVTHTLVPTCAPPPPRGPRRPGPPSPGHPQGRLGVGGPTRVPGIGHSECELEGRRWSPLLGTGQGQGWGRGAQEAMALDWGRQPAQAAGADSLKLHF